MRTYTLEDKLTDQVLQLPLLHCLEDYCRITGLIINRLEISSDSVLFANFSRPDETAEIRYLADNRMLLKHHSGMQSIRVFEVDIVEDRLLYTRLSG